MKAGGVRKEEPIVRSIAHRSGNRVGNAGGGSRKRMRAAAQAGRAEPNRTTEGSGSSEAGAGRKVPVALCYEVAARDSRQPRMAGSSDACGGQHWCG
jgi:hypothetical protein